MTPHRRPPKSDWRFDDKGRVRTWHGPMTCPWVLDNGERCDLEMAVDGGAFTCPSGHRRLHRISQRVDDIVLARQGSPGLLHRFFERKGDRE